MLHHLYYSNFSLSIIIGATIGANTIIIGAIYVLIGATLGASLIIIGASFVRINYDIGRFCCVIGATLYDIGILDNYLERCIITK